MKIYQDDEVEACRKWYGWKEGDDIRHRKRTSKEDKYAGLQGVVRKHVEVHCSYTPTLAHLRIEYQGHTAKRAT